MNMKAAKAKLDVRFGAVREVFTNTENDFMYWAFQKSSEYDSIAEWLRELALEEYYKETKK